MHELSFEERKCKCTVANQETGLLAKRGQLLIPETTKKRNSLEQYLILK